MRRENTENVYTYTYKDVEGDEYQSDEFHSKQEARNDFANIQLDDQYARIIETWIDDCEGNYLGRW